MKKLLSLLMATLLILSTAVAAFAQDTKKIYDYDLYFNIGDSIARGQNLPATIGDERDEYYNDELNYSGQWLAQGSFPQIIRDSITGKMFNANLQCMGLRTIEAYYGIGGDVDPATYDDYYEKDFHSHVHDEDNPRGGIDYWIDTFTEGAASADLITLEVGTNDVFYSAQARSGLYGVGDVSAQRIADFLKCSLEGLMGFKKYYPKIVERIFELQKAKKGTDKDVKIALVGYYNPFGNCAVTNDILIHCGEILDGYIKSMNKTVKAIADKYEQCYYVDIYNVETNITRNDDNLMNILAVNASAFTHPDEYGNAWIAEQILNAIPSTVEAVKEPITNIVLSLPNKCDVYLVTVDGKKADFTQDGHRLVVKNNTKSSKMMTVYGDNMGTSVIFTYGLSFDKNDGYTAHRKAGSINVYLVIDRLMTAIKNFFNKIFAK